MPVWTPEPLWAGEDVAIIGGGDSLRPFPWDVLQDMMTIGCNIAFRHGKEICSVAIFGDRQFFVKYHEELIAYGGPVFNASKMRDVKLPTDWTYTMKRVSRGLSLNGFGWNGHTGAAAINLALLLGSQRVFLLGFDMHQKGKKASWHNEYEGDGKNRRASYPKYLRGFDDVVKDWKEKFGDREIINVNDDSALKCFPMMSMAKFLKERRVA